MVEPTSDIFPEASISDVGCAVEHPPRCYRIYQRRLWVIAAGMHFSSEERNSHWWTGTQSSNPNGFMWPHRADRMLFIIIFLMIHSYLRLLCFRIAVIHIKFSFLCCILKCQSYSTPFFHPVAFQRLLFLPASPFMALRSTVTQFILLMKFEWLPLHNITLKFSALVDFNLLLFIHP